MDLKGVILLARLDIAAMDNLHLQSVLSMMFSLDRCLTKLVHLGHLETFQASQPLRLAHHIISFPAHQS